jgi:hypothetical protein
VIISPLLEAALIELLEKGLIKRDNKVIFVHRVVQEAMNYYSIKDLQASFDAAVSIIRCLALSPYTRSLQGRLTFPLGIRGVSKSLDQRRFA